MKLKNLTIAIAMASLGMASFGAQAEDGTSFYGSVRIGLEHKDKADTTALVNYASRMGFKAETEVADGLKGFGHYEFRVGTDASDDAAITTRKAYVGLKGGFGRVRIGQDYHTFYNSVVVITDQAIWDGELGGSALGTNPIRTGEAITYDTNLGQVGLGATAYVGDDKMGNGYELGATYDIETIKVGAGYSDTDGTGKMYGIGAGGKIGPVSYGVTYKDRDKVGTAYDLFAGYNGAYITTGQAKFDAVGKAKSKKTNGVTLGYTLPIGKKTSTWFEVNNSKDKAGKKETTVRAVLKYDF